MALKAFPANTPSALQTLALMVDDMWYWAGDRSTDFSWYTKRALLTSIYVSTGMCRFYALGVGRRGGRGEGKDGSSRKGEEEVIVGEEVEGVTS